MYAPFVGCQPCPIGTFQPNQGELQCNACETNHTTRNTGSTYSGDCIVKGRFVDFLNEANLAQVLKLLQNKINTVDTLRRENDPYASFDTK